MKRLGTIKARRRRDTAAGDASRSSLAEWTQSAGACATRFILQVDVAVCTRCGGEARIIGFVTEPQVVRRILAHLERRAVDAWAGPWAGAAMAPG